MPHVSASPSFQKLCLNGVELENDEKTLRDYAIVPGQILTLEILQEEKDNSTSSNVLEAGFKGTNLLPTPSQTSHNPLENDCISSKSDEWSCQQCTFLNASRDTCEMCNRDRIIITVD